MSSHESKSPRTELMQLVFSAKWWRICKNGVVANTCNTLIQAMKWDMVHTMYGQNDFFFFFTRNANFTSLVSPAGTPSLKANFWKKKFYWKKGEHTCASSFFEGKCEDTRWKERIFFRGEERGREVFPKELFYWKNRKSISKRKKIGNLFPYIIWHMHKVPFLLKNRKLHISIWEKNRKSIFFCLSYKTRIRNF